MRTLRAFFRSPTGLLGIAALLLIVVVAAGASSLLGSATTSLSSDANRGPMPGHPFGTDPLGRDILLRIVVATQLSIGLGFAAAGVAFAIGVPVGATAALMPPRLRSLALRVIDSLLAF